MSYKQPYEHYIKRYLTLTESYYRLQCGDSGEGDPDKVVENLRLLAEMHADMLLDIIKYSVDEHLELKATAHYWESKLEKLNKKE